MSLITEPSSPLSTVAFLAACIPFFIDSSVSTLIMYKEITSTAQQRRESITDDFEQEERRIDSIARFVPDTARSRALMTDWKEGAYDQTENSVTE